MQQKFIILYTAIFWKAVDIIAKSKRSNFSHTQKIVSASVSSVLFSLGVSVGCLVDFLSLFILQKMKAKSSWKEEAVTMWGVSGLNTHFLKVVAWTNSHPIMSDIITLFTIWKKYQHVRFQADLLKFYN